MEGNSNYSNSLNINTLSRNTPVALVVGAAGFLGSHLVEELLKKNIQVVGVDDFSTGKKENLEVSIKDKDFHLANISASQLVLDLERLDYIFIVAEGQWDPGNVLKLAKINKSKIVFVSSIELYSNQVNHKLAWFKHAESMLARFAAEHKLNARVIRLGPVFGPRMHFRFPDPTIRLLQAAIRGEIQKESAALDFSSRAIYADDAVLLIIKSVFSGSTALKIYDGAAYSPIKVSDLRQVLLDPLWYEQKGFAPSELPPWPTPNLVKTMKELSWKPHTPLLTSLKDTINFFRGKEIDVPDIVDDEDKWPVQKLNLGYRSFEPAVSSNESKGQVEQVDKINAVKKKKKISLWSKKAVFLFIGWMIIVLGIFYPIGALAYGVLAFRQNIGEATINLSAGNTGKALNNIRAAGKGVEEIETVFNGLEIISQIEYINTFYEKGERVLRASKQVTKAAEETILGSQKVFESLRIVSGETQGDLNTQFLESEVELRSADTRLSLATVELDNALVGLALPQFINLRVSDIKDKLSVYRALVSRARAAAQILPKIVGTSGKKSYLILLQNNGELRATGGFIGTIARVDFEGGKLKKVDVADVYEIDGHLKLHVEPPKEIKEDLGQAEWFLRDSNFEPDFPTSARQAEWFYSKETGLKVDGTLAMDVTAMENLLSVTGPIDLSDYSETITSDNLFEKALTYSEQGFFPGSKAKKNFLTSLSTEVLNKIFFSKKQNWAGFLNAAGDSFSEKHLLIYLSDPGLFSYLVSNNWAGTLPRQQQKVDGELSDMLALVESNFGANKANYYLDRKLNLETTIGKEGELHHKLRVAYTNRSPADVWPAGKYKNRLRIYLPLSSKLKKMLWGEADITSKAQTFVDYGRVGYSVILELQPKEQKTLVVDWDLSEKIEFNTGKAVYRLDVIKQAGTLKDPLEWNLTYPINYHLSTQSMGTASQQEYNISTDLSTDRRFEVVFTK